MIRLIPLLLISVLFSCANRSLDFKSYYFPYEKMENGHHYLYVSDQGDSILWKMTYNSEDRLFRTEGFFNGDYTETVREEITDDRSKMLAYYQVLSGTRTKGIINKDEIVYWEIDDSDSFEWELDYVYEDTEDELEDLEVTMRLSKVRSLEGPGSDFKWNGQNLETVLFKDEFERHYSFNKVYDPFVVKYYFESSYAEGIGLVKFVGHFEDNTTVSWKLTDIIEY